MNIKKKRKTYGMTVRCYVEDMDKFKNLLDELNCSHADLFEAMMKLFEEKRNGR